MAGYILWSYEYFRGKSAWVSLVLLGLLAILFTIGVLAWVTMIK